MLHVHIFLVAPLGAGNMPESGADQHECRIAVRKTAHHAGAPADLTIQPFNDVVGADASPMFRRKICIDQGLFHAVPNLLCRLFQLHGAQFRHHCARLFSGSFLALLRVDRLEHLDTSSTLRCGATEKMLRWKPYHAMPVLDLRGPSHSASEMLGHLSSDGEFDVTRSNKVCKLCFWVTLFIFVGAVPLVRRKLIIGSFIENKP